MKVMIERVTLQLSSLTANHYCFSFVHFCIVIFNACNVLYVQCIICIIVLLILLNTVIYTVQRKKELSLSSSRMETVIERLILMQNSISRNIHDNSYPLCLEKRYTHRHIPLTIVIIGRIRKQCLKQISFYTYRVYINISICWDILNQNFKSKCQN